MNSFKLNGNFDPRRTKLWFFRRELQWIDGFGQAGAHCNADDAFSCRSRRLALAEFAMKVL